MRSNNGAIEIDKVIAIIIAVIAIIVVALIIFLNKDKLTELMGTVARILRFGA